MNEKEKKFRESIKLDEKLLKEYEKQIKTYNKDYKSRMELADKIAQEDFERQCQAEEEWKILSEFGPIL